MNTRAYPWKWLDLCGIELSAVSKTEKLVSLLGGVIAIGLLLLITKRACGLTGAAALVTSMGASAVLLFGVPHGQLSQPWPVFAGHVISALVGVACARWIPHPELAGACAVGIAIGAMHQFKCIHPPGGATALTAVLGGQAIRDLGFSFVLCPVMLNAAVMVVLAVAINWAFHWRRYPAALNRPKPAPASAAMNEPSHEEIVAALRSLDSFVDITEDDLVRLVRTLAKAQQASGKVPVVR